MRAFAGSLLVVVSLLGVGCDGGAAPKDKAEASTAPATDIGEVVATVNGVQIGAKEFEQAAARKTPASGDSLSLEEKKEVLQTIVEEKLLYAEAIRKGVDKDPKVQKVVVNTLVREDVFNQIKNSDFSDEVLQAYYDAHKDEFIVPEKVQIKRILIKTGPDRTEDQAKSQAEKIRSDVEKTPDSFKDLASKFSEDPYKHRGGDVGFVSKEGKPGLDQAVVEKAFTVEVGKVSDVFKTEDGYNVILVAAKREQLERTFQQMKGTVLRKAKNAKQEDAYKSYVEALKKDAKVNIDDAKLGAIEIKSQRRPFAPGMGEGAEEGGEENAGELVGAPAAGADGAAAAEGGATGPRPVLPGAGGPGAGGPGGPGGKRPMPGRPMPNTAPGH
jgi:parvulin-like peptidyl-prolyl isomerase